MSSGAKIFLITSVVVLGLIALLIYYFSTLINWSESYNMDSKDPYGTVVISDLLKHQSGINYYSIREVGDSMISDFNGARFNYFFIGDRYFASKKQISDLLTFIAHGNNAFIAANEWPDALTEVFADSACNKNDQPDHFSDTVSRINLSGNLSLKNDLILKYNFNKVNYGYGWQYLDKTAFCSESIPVYSLGSYKNGKINFIRRAYGRGNLFIHTTPIAFTNYFLVNENAFNYTQNVLSVLPQQYVIWDEYSKMRKFDFTENENSAGQPQGPLMFILSKRSLKWAWYLSLLLLIIYMIFIGKRRQRVIPVVESVKNTSLEYIKTVGKLYFMENDHRSIAIHKMKQFQTFLRTRYFILTTQRNDLLAEKIATVSGVDVTLVKEIFLQFSLIEVHEKISEEEFLNFHKLLTEFYKSSV